MTDPRPAPTTSALRHPLRRLAELTGGPSAFPLLLLFGLNAADELDRTAFAILLPEIRSDLGLSLTAVLTAVAVVLVIALLLQVPIAQWADRTDRVRLALAGAAVWAAFSFGTGLASGVVMLSIMRAGSGLGKAVVDPTHNSLLADWYPVETRPRVFSFHRAANALGSGLGPLFAGLLAHEFGWRVPFFIFAVPTLLLVLAGLRLPSPPRGRQERSHQGVTGEALDTDEAPPSLAEGWRLVWSIQSLRRIYSSLPFLATGLIGFVTLAALKFESLGLNAAERGFAAAAVEPFALVGLVIGGTLGTKMLARGAGFVIKLVAVAAVSASGFAVVFSLAPNVPVAIAANIGIVVSLAIVGPGVLAALSLAIPPRARSLGFSMGSLWVIPGLVILPVIGSLADSWGLSRGLLLMCPVLLVGGLIIASAGNLIGGDIEQVWTAAAARSEALAARHQGRLPLAMVRGLDVFYGDVQVLFGVDLEIHEGEIIALLGTNGAGKSTLLRAMSGVLPATRGAVLVDGRDTTFLPAHEVAGIGMINMPGGQGVFPGLTVAENLKLARWMCRKDKAEGQRRTEGALARFPVLADRLDEPAANLSGGQQQMLALAMVLLTRPRLLLIDELSLGLAPVVVDELLDAIRDLREAGTTVVLVEQSVNIALTVADRAYFLEKGEVRFSGPTADLLDRPDVLRSIFLDGAAAALGSEPAEAGRPSPDDLWDPDPRPHSHPEALPALHPENIPTAPLSTAPNPTAPNPTAPNPTAPNPTAPNPARAAHRRTDPAVPASARPGAAGGNLRPPALQAQDLSVHFGGIPAVSGASLTVQPGEIVGIIGPNGAGKTTLFDLISGVTRADSGRVELQGVDVTSLPPHRRATAGLGRSFQDARLFSTMTVADTLATALDRWVDVRDPFSAVIRSPAWRDTEDAVGGRVDELVRMFGLERFRDKAIGELSTGSRRVVDLACVLAHGADVVLLDEPSSGIAQREAEALGPLLRRLASSLDAALVVVEHDVPLLASLCDRLVAMDSGRVIADGTPEAVLADPAVVASYLGTGVAASRSGSSRGGS